jgi:hypothetical protein
MLGTLATATGVMAPELEASRFNPFKEGVNVIDPLYSTFVRWNGREDQDHDFLKLDRTYKVVSAEIEGCYTDLIIQDVSTGQILPDKYNSVLFESLPTFLGYSDILPKIGERFDMVKMDVDARQMLSWNTGRVIAMENLGNETWAVITRNSLYIVKITKSVEPA